VSDRSKTLLSLIFLVSVAGTLAIYAFVFAQSKSTLSDVEGMFGCFAIAWIIGFVFYRLNVFGVKNRTPRAEAALVGWTTKSGNGALALLIRKAAVAVFVGALIAFAILFWVSH
jgi:hypothetical protein